MILEVDAGPEDVDAPPLYFKMGAAGYFVRELLDRWFGPDSIFFKVRADDGNYILRHALITGQWTLESFRRET